MGNVFETKTYNVSEFIKWHSGKELNLSPKFQRNSVWNDKAKSYLIDSILRGLPIPPVFLRQSVDVKVSKIFREVIDGQQRLRTIIEFYDDQFPIKGPFAEKEYRGKKYSQLPDDHKQSFLEYEIATQIVRSQPDSVIYDMFARLNTNNMVLNAQEVRNARFWGYFKGLVYELGREFKDLSIEWKMFNDKDLSRMKDYELINSLVIYLIDGLRAESPKIVDDYYRRYDEDFDLIDQVQSRFFELILRVKDIYDGGYTLTYFNRPRYFWTLFVCIDRYFTEYKQWPEVSKLIQKISRLENALESDVPVNDYPDLLKIKEYHLIRTTSAKEREFRVSAVYKALFK